MNIKWSPDKNARNSMFSVYKSKQQQKEDWFQKRRYS